MKKFISFSLMVSLILTLSACLPDFSTVEDPLQALMDAKDLAMWSFYDVLQSETPFISIDNEGYEVEVLLEDYCKSVLNLETIGDYSEILEFTVVDMDGDEIPEVVLNFKGNGNKEVLRYYNGEVFGYSFKSREMNRLKRDGSFYWSGGAGFNGYSVMQFHEMNLGFIDFAVYDFDFDPGTAHYYGHGEEVSDLNTSVSVRSSRKKRT